MNAGVLLLFLDVLKSSCLLIHLSGKKKKKKKKQKKKKKK